jgi:hypothetical protein
MSDRGLTINFDTKVCVCRRGIDVATQQFVGRPYPNTVARLKNLRRNAIISGPSMLPRPFGGRRDVHST